MYDTTIEKFTCETCKGNGYIHTAVYSHPTIADGTERVEVCDECKHKNT